jgi:hypothetical protein
VGNIRDNALRGCYLFSFKEPWVGENESLGKQSKPANSLTDNHPIAAMSFMIAGDIIDSGDFGPLNGDSERHMKPKQIAPATSLNVGGLGISEPLSSSPPPI